MTTLKNSIIVTHRVLHPAGTGAPAKYTYTSSSVHKYLDYTARQGRHKERGGCDERITGIDRDLELAKDVGNDIHSALEYGERSGRFADKGMDMPFKEGEVSGGIWDAHGVRTLEDVEREIMESGSNVVQSVLTVSREWAEALGMDCKEAWQALVREKWPEFMAAWKVIPPENCRWVAEYHVDGKMSLHVHVMSWDGSGKHFVGFDGIPHDVIESSKRVIREEIMKDVSLERSIEKDFIRQAAITLARNALGRAATSEELSAVREKAARAGEVFEITPFAGDSMELGAQIRRVIDTLPASGMGRSAFGAQGPDTKVQALFAVDVLKTDPEIGRLAQEWRILIEHGADILGLSGAVREHYIQKEVRDLDVRLASTVLERAARDNKPWERSEELGAARRELTNLIRDAVPLERRAELAETSDRAAIAHEAIRVLSEPAVATAYREYREDVLAFAMDHSRLPLLPQQEKRLSERVEKDIVGRATWILARGPSERELRYGEQEIGRNLAISDKAKVHGALRGLEKDSISLTAKERREIAHCVDRMAEELSRGKPRSELKDLASPAIEIIAGKPELTASLNRACALNSRVLGPEGRGRLAQAQKDAIFDELAKAARRESDQVIAVRTKDEERRDRERLESNVSELVMQAVRNARVSRVLDGFGGPDLEVHMKRRSALLEYPRSR